MVIDYPSLCAVLCKSQQSRWSCEVQQLYLLCFSSLWCEKSNVYIVTVANRAYYALVCVFNKHFLLAYIGVYLLVIPTMCI